MRDGERGGLAPVIPLFGPGSRVGGGDGGEDRTENRAESREENGAPPRRAPSRPAVDGAAGDTDAAAVSDAAREKTAAPSVTRARRAPGPHVWHTTWDDLDPDDAISASDADGDGDRGDEREGAQQRVLRRLRTRQLSSAEAATLLRQPDADGHRLDDESVDALLRGLHRHGYLDDARLADQLVHAGVERKGQGRRAIAGALASRGIPRDVADAALRALDDDDDERALAFAQSRMRGMRKLDRDTAVRRLVGQLSRRGYPGPVALAAARRAWDAQP